MFFLHIAILILVLITLCMTIAIYMKLKKTEKYASDDKIWIYESLNTRASGTSTSGPENYENGFAVVKGKPVKFTNEGSGDPFEYIQKINPSLNPYTDFTEVFTVSDKNKSLLDEYAQIVPGMVVSDRSESWSSVLEDVLDGKVVTEPYIGKVIYDIGVDNGLWEYLKSINPKKAEPVMNSIIHLS